MKMVHGLAFLTKIIRTERISVTIVLIGSVIVLKDSPATRKIGQQAEPNLNQKILLRSELIFRKERSSG